jgi:serine/threonine protein kinase
MGTIIKAPARHAAAPICLLTWASLCCRWLTACPICYRYFFRQIVEGLDYCHTNHIAHRDLKLANFLLSTDKPMRWGSGVVSNL